MDRTGYRDKHPPLAKRTICSFCNVKIDCGGYSREPIEPTTCKTISFRCKQCNKFTKVPEDEETTLWFEHKAVINRHSDKWCGCYRADEESCHSVLERLDREARLRRMKESIRLDETYQAIYEMQQKFGITDEYLLSTVRFTQQDREHRENLIQLLELLKKARDYLITWYLKQTLVELNVTISLVTAKIKFIEYKLGLCDGLDLHQACSISLVDFCNILAELTVLNVSPSERKTMHQISEETNIPVWLSHYRNQICHVPSEGPSISILVPLVQKSLNYMKESFWLKVIEHETFDENKFRKIVAYVAKLTHVRYVNKRLHIKKDIEMGRKRMKFAEMSLEKYRKVCIAFRRSLLHNPEQAVDILTRFMVSAKFEETSRNHPLLIVQLIYAKCFERFVFKLISLAESKPGDKKIISWLNKIICLISSPKQEQLIESLTEMGINATEVIKYVDIAPIKCCRIAYRLMCLDGPAFKRCLLRMRYKLLPILGKQKTLLLIKMTRITGFDRKI